MIDILTGLGYGIATFALVTGVSLIVLNTFAVIAGNDTEAGQAVTTLIGYLGTGNGGLVNWVPAIIALTIGVAFLAVLLPRRSRKV